MLRPSCGCARRTLNRAVLVRLNWVIMADKKLTTAEILAQARRKDGAGGSANTSEIAAAPAASAPPVEEAPAAAKPPVDAAPTKPAAKPGSTADILAAARAPESRCCAIYRCSTEEAGWRKAHIHRRHSGGRSGQSRGEPSAGCQSSQTRCEGGSESAGSCGCRRRPSLRCRDDQGGTRRQTCL